MQKIGNKRKLVLTLAIMALMFGSVFLTSAYAAAPPYTATFTETGLPTGASYTVSLTNATGTKTSSSTAAGSQATVSGLYNGTYVLSSAATPGTGHKYSGLIWNTPSSTVVGISGAYVGTVSFSEEFLLNFTESGLASGTSWSVLVGSTEYSSSGSYLALNELNGTYSYSVLGIQGYSVTPSSGTITVNGGNVSIPVKFTQVSTTAPKYPVKFVETGLPSGMQWYVTVSGQTSASTSNTNSLSLPNGTYSYSISPIGGHYYASTLSGTFTVDGNLNLPKWMNGALQINVTYYYGYTVEFREEHLSPYVPWSVTLSNSTISMTNSTTGSSTEIAFLIKNGTYNYTVNIAPDWKITADANGKVTVSGSEIAVLVDFAEVYFKVTFIETGLPVGTPWILTVNGVLYTTTNGTLIFSEHNGTLDYIAETVPGYTAKPSSGVVIVEYSNNTLVTIVYSPTTTVKSGTGNSTGGGFSLPSMSSITSFFHTATAMLTIVIVVIVLIGLVVVAETRGYRSKGENKGESKSSHSKYTKR